MIDNYYFVKEINKEQFVTNVYTVTVQKNSGKTFNYKETLTVPEEVLNPSNGYFCLKIMEIYYSQKDNGYCVNYSGYSAVKYEYIDDQTVRLSKPQSKI